VGRIPATQLQDAKFASDTAHNITYLCGWRVDAEKQAYVWVYRLTAANGILKIDSLRTVFGRLQYDIWLDNSASNLYMTVHPYADEPDNTYLVHLALGSRWGQFDTTLVGNGLYYVRLFGNAENHVLVSAGDMTSLQVVKYNLTDAGLKVVDAAYDLKYGGSLFEVKGTKNQFRLLGNIVLNPSLWDWSPLKP
jgi:hypothetical protein